MAELKKTIVCICCPLGCEIVAEKGGAGYRFKNQKCKKGRDYALSELLNPVRHVTTTIVLGGDPGRRLPVRTSLPVPKDKMFAVVKEIKQLKLTEPVSAGQILIKNIAGTDADIIASDHSQGVRS
ncbi:MAG: DUF1667 domain-containing protein [Dethiobacteria bacterium]|jgi:CxxC motif-containing protein